MADDDDIPKDTEPDETTRDESSEAEASAPTDDPDEPKTAQERFNEVIATVQHNQDIQGELIVHFAERDVHMPTDGLSALRLLRCYTDRTRAYADKLTVSSPAENLWYALDLEKVLAISWVPRPPEDASRIAIDPPGD